MSCLHGHDFCEECQSCNPDYQYTGCPEGETPGRCVTYGGDNLHCINVVKGQRYDSILAAINAKVCQFVAGSDRYVGANEGDPLPGPLIDKLMDSDSIQWSIQIDGGIRKVMGSVNMDWVKEQLLLDSAFVEAICNACPEPETTTQEETTTIPATTTTTEEETTTESINVLVENNVVGGVLSYVNGISGFSLPSPTINGGVVTGHHNNFTASVSVGVTGAFSPSKLVLKRNGIILECLNVTSSGTHTFGSYTFGVSHILSVEFINEPCEEETTTLGPATTTTTTTVEETTTQEETTTLPVNTLIQNEVLTANITNIAGASGFTLGSSVGPNQFRFGHHNAFNTSIAVTVTGTLVNRSLRLKRNGTELQCIDVNSPSVYIFNNFVFSSSDYLTIELVQVPCTPETTTPAPCLQPEVISVEVIPDDSTTTSEETTTSTSTTTVEETTTTEELEGFLFYALLSESPDDPYEDLSNEIDNLEYQETFVVTPTGDISVSFPVEVNDPDGVLWVLKIPETLNTVKDYWENGTSMFNKGPIGGVSIVVRDVINFGGYNYYLTYATNPFYFQDSPTNNITLTES